jgi:hypothetical protein
MNARITRVSNNSPTPIVVLICATTVIKLTAIAIIVNANTRPAAVTTFDGAELTDQRWKVA